MKFLIFIALGILIIFVSFFIFGFVVAFIKNKKGDTFKKHAFYLFSQLSENEKSIVKNMWLSFQQNDPESANKIANKLGSSEIQHISTLLDPANRPSELSAGNKLDHTTWIVYFNKAKEMNFDKVPSTIIAGVGLNGLEEQF